MDERQFPVLWHQALLTLVPLPLPVRFHMDERQFPVLWHQALLTFVERYKNDMSAEQRDLLLDLCNSQRHAVITPEVR